MKTHQVILTVLIIFCLTTSFQCEKCETANLRLDNTRSWLPLKGRTQLTFADITGTPTSFPLRVVDTAVTSTVEYDCSGQPFRFEYITTSLYLNQSRTDSIYFNLSSNELCVTAWSNNSPNIGICDIFRQAKEGRVAKQLFNYSVGTRTYSEAILLLSSPPNSNNIDSIVIANNTGIVGFRYANRNYALQ